MGLEYRSALIFGWKAEELRRKMAEAESEERYDYVDKIYEQLDKSEFILDINEDFLYVGKIISDCGIYDNADNADTIFIDEINFKEFAREAYEQIKPLKEFWEPAEPPQLIHFCYVR